MVLSLKTYIISKQLLLKRLNKDCKKNKQIDLKPFIISIMDLDNSIRLLYGLRIKGFNEIHNDLICYLEEYIKI
jgi:ADP-glucose pyrophosphorylase